MNVEKPKNVPVLKKLVDLWRIENNGTQGEFAINRAGIGPTDLSRLLNERIPFKPGQLEQIVSGLGYSGPELAKVVRVIRGDSDASDQAQDA
ncbi:MAG: helix-turn-helix domain-containing protein [Planctomycetota bacterium]|jgi:hypothetical protein